MYAWFYQGNTFLHLPILGLCLFIAVFAMVVFRVYVRSTASSFNSVAALPLTDDTHPLNEITGDRHGH